MLYIIILILIVVIITISILEKFKKKHSKYKTSISKFNKTVHNLPNTHTNISTTQSIKEDYLATYNFVSKSAYNTSTEKDFMRSYENLDEIILKANKEFKEIQQLKLKYDKDVAFANQLIKDINSFSNEYFTTKDKNYLKSKYKSYYDLFNSTAYAKIKNRTDSVFNEKYSHLDQIVASANHNYIKSELNKYNKFFDNIDGKSLDSQQREAVITDNNCNLILAGAGSGKTLTIAAKVKYLVECKNVDPNEILLISFTQKAAQEMTERINQRLGIPITAITFHKLGLDILKENSNKNIISADIMDEIISRYFREAILDDADSIKNILEFFLYYLNISKNIEQFETYDDYIESQISNDTETLKSKYMKKLVESKVEGMKQELTTIHGERVKSMEEVMIANFLFMHGINYEYERKYPFESEDKNKEYHPDFYLTDYDLYLEHFGITKDNKLPWLSASEEQKYLKEMEWKRKFHNQNCTTLLETYSYYNFENRLLKELKKILEDHNVTLKPVNMLDVYQKVYAKGEDKQFKELEKLIKSFIQLFKSNGYSEDDLLTLNNVTDDEYTSKRNAMFLKLVKPILGYYENSLKKQGVIDFNDMINQATKLIYANNINFKYKYILIDEYQDISVGRYNLIKAIIGNTDKKLICVGDDWQSIYRFTGSDINLFTNFKKYFGESSLTKIEKTYRNSQQLINIASSFITKNPNQLHKNLVSDKHIDNPLKIINYYRDMKAALKIAIADIYKKFGEEAEILLLGRTQYDINYYLDNDFDYSSSTNKVLYFKYPKMNIKFLTVHSSKGLEADNVIIINMRNGILGFPNKISDDSVLSMVLQKDDKYIFAEERRLFYVAMTRTRNSTYLIAPDKRYSTFIKDLKNLHGVKTYHTSYENTVESNQTCPKCKKGHLVLREIDGKKSLVCSNYPYCTYTK